MSADFTPVSGFIGSALTGLAAVLLLIANGRIAGVSGIVGGLLARVPGETGWRAAFVLGLWLGALVYCAIRGELFEIELEAMLPVSIAAGLLVGTPGISVRPQAPAAVVRWSMHSSRPCSRDCSCTTGSPQAVTRGSRPATASGMGKRREIPRAPARRPQGCRGLACRGFRTAPAFSLSDVLLRIVGTHEQTSRCHPPS